jgi:hypothetical protein
MRLIIGRDPDNRLNVLGQPHLYPNYVILNNPSNDIHPLKVPSGFQTGIKIVHGFVIEENETTELILDFDACKSVVRAGASGLWLLKPTIKVLETASFSIVSGTVFGNSGGSSIAIAPSIPLQGALVSAQQIPNGNPEVIASTTSEEGGKYALFIHPGDYYIVGSKIGPEKDTATARILGYDPVCVPITTEAGVTYPDTNLVLAEPKITGTVKGSVSISIPDGTQEQFVTLSFRREVSCGSGGSKVVEVKFINLAAGTDYSEELTPGDYIVHAFTADRSDEQPVTVTGGVDTTLNIEL